MSSILNTDNRVHEGHFLCTRNTNGMCYNSSKCKELTIKKRGNRDLYSSIGMIPSCKEVEILGVAFQMLHGYNQSEIDLLFTIQ